MLKCTLKCVSVGTEGAQFSGYLNHLWWYRHILWLLKYIFNVYWISLNRQNSPILKKLVIWVLVTVVKFSKLKFQEISKYNITMLRADAHLSLYEGGIYWCFPYHGGPWLGSLDYKFQYLRICSDRTIYVSPLMATSMSQFTPSLDCMPTNV